MNMKSKEKWINKVIDSSTSLETKTHQPFLYRKTMNRIEQGTLQTTRSWWYKPILASLFFLIVANSVIVYNYNSIEVNEAVSYKEERIITNEDITTILDEYALQDVEVSLYNF